MTVSFQAPSPAPFMKKNSGREEPKHRRKNDTQARFPRKKGVLLPSSAHAPAPCLKAWREETKRMSEPAPRRHGLKKAHSRKNLKNKNILLDKHLETEE